MNSHVQVISKGVQRWCIASITTTLLLFSANGQARAGCGLTALPIDPINDSRTDLFIGKGKTIELEFINMATGPVIDVFPEPPLIVRNQSTGRSCEIDGGIWVRKHVYLSANEKQLLLLEYSGANEFLKLYDTATCKQRREIDVSEGPWVLEGDTLRVGHGCTSRDIASCSAVRQFTLGKSCKFIPHQSTKK